MIDLTDWELVAMAQQDDSSAFEELMQRYQPLIISQHSGQRLSDMNLDEWQQEARIVLWKIMQRFNVERKNAFGTYFKVSLVNKRRDLARRAKAQKRRLLRGKLELDSDPVLRENVLIDHTMPDAVVETRDTAAHCFDKLLSSFECQVQRCMLGQMSIEEIAASLEADVNQVKNAIERIRKKLRAEFK